MERLVGLFRKGRLIQWPQVTALDSQAVGTCHQKES